MTLRHHFERRVLLLGLDGSGKTTLLYQIKLGEVVTTIPTIGFNVEDVAGINIWDVGGQDKIRCLWRHYTENSQALIWTIDVTDPSRLNESKKELHKILLDFQNPIPILVFATKMPIDRSDSSVLHPKEIATGLHLEKLVNPWHIQPCNVFERARKFHEFGPLSGFCWLLGRNFPSWSSFLKHAQKPKIEDEDEWKVHLDGMSKEDMVEALCEARSTNLHFKSQVNEMQEEITTLKEQFESAAEVISGWEDKLEEMMKHL